MIYDDTTSKVIKTCASAASVATISCLQHDKPLGYATLEGEGGQENGIVVVCLNREETLAMKAFIATRGGALILGKLN